MKFEYRPVRFSETIANVLSAGAFPFNALFFPQNILVHFCEPSIKDHQKCFCFLSTRSRNNWPVVSYSNLFEAKNDLKAYPLVTSHELNFRLRVDNIVQWTDVRSYQINGLVFEKGQRMYIRGFQVNQLSCFFECQRQSDIPFCDIILFYKWRCGLPPLSSSP